MNHLPRHKVVYSEDIHLLKLQVNELIAEGWQPLGEPAMATPADSMRRAYWVQALFKGDALSRTPPQAERSESA